jgi:hypothetical protein
MAFNLPPFWSPGVALPDYVRVEDLQRGAFATRQMPRGTYDPERVTAQGYAVPAYVMDEGTGQGTFVTKWMPRGTVPHVAQFLQQPRNQLVMTKPTAGGGTNYVITHGAAPKAADPYHQYGKKVADHVMTQIKKVPPPHRKGILKKLLDKVDPRLWTRIQSTASKATKAGVPAPRALHHAIATEFRGGMLRELQTVGKTGSIKATSQVGMGCYGCGPLLATLGDTAPTATPPHWERAKAGDPNANSCGFVWVGPEPAPAMTGCAPPRVHVAGDAGRTDIGPGAPVDMAVFVACGTKDRAGQLIKPCNPNLKPGMGPTVQIGPFLFRGGATTDGYTYDDPAKVPPEVTAWLNKAVDPYVSGNFNSQIGTNRSDAKPGDDNGTHYWLGYGGSYQVSSDYASSDPDRYPANSIISSVDHPVSHKPYGIFLFLRGKDPHCDATGCYKPVMMVRFAPIAAGGGSRSWWDQAVDAVGSFISGAADAISKAACQALQSGGAQAAAAVAAGPAAGAGAAAAAQACGKPGDKGAGAGIAPMPTMPPPAGPNLNTILLLGGAGLAAIYLLTSKD